MREPPSPSRANQKAPLERSGQLTPYLSEDTIAAIASAVGGAVAIIRVSGPEAFRIAEKLSSQKLSHFEARKLYRARLAWGEEKIDDALLVKFVAPESFTGEDVIEFQIHGGVFLASRLMEILLLAGARQALPGEFSFRAVKNGKTSLSQAEAVADLISASNESAIDLALEKMSGAQNRFLAEIAAHLRKLAVLGEVGIDFSDQDVEEVSLPVLKKQIAALTTQLRSLQASYARGKSIQSGVPVALVGLPNSGKSSFFNSLLGEDRSIVSEIAGTTRDIVREQITLRGEKMSVTLRMEDTAGLRATDNAVEKIGIERSYRAAEKAELILALFDPTGSFEELQNYWLNLGRAVGSGLSAKCIGIFTKSDLVSPAEMSHFIEKTKSFTLINTCVTTSVITGHGIVEATRAITHFCEKWVGRSPGELLLTRLDHLEAVKAATEHLARAEKAPEIELFASDIRQALFALGPLIGDTLADDVLGKIFSDFCIGK